MLRKALLSLWFFVPASLAEVSQTCIWKNGDLAEDFVPCANSTVSSGSCCKPGETCLSSGLCYGNIGLVYRGACINEWGGDCVTYCDNYGERKNFLKAINIANSPLSTAPDSWANCKKFLISAASPVPFRLGTLLI
jgi:hypothetical protein